MKRRQDTATTQNKSIHVKRKTVCCLHAKVGNETDFIPVFGTEGKTEQLYENELHTFQGKYYLAKYIVI
jgi:hypothetical protein